MTEHSILACHFAATAAREGPILILQDTTEYTIERVGDPLRVYLAEEVNFSIPTGIGNRDGVPQLRDIDSDKCFFL
ncbi:hypothetical protein [Chelativorans sp. BNC1]|uniref:hypothetical protein n=1 Tax=Chelativorans TaxID=449972 RepID=UPI00003A3A8B